MGGGARYPYPKYVWSPAGGWWVRPSNWASNTAIVAGGMAAVLYAVWRVSANNEQRITQPSRFIPSMLWAKEYEDRKLKLDKDK
ncbi:hypothetical protein AGABI1DRAFT_82136 [Agaricus bisporus var. burnettii JB137-S8]|uniref:Uncharacterized protein n=2 Tax=Agaricus bisporus var. burnettii TaxID=192524 RepID=K5XFX4_AGABU|nr:hypothetical protein AGABI2DRAFT_133629 [Agaricus bisporus var. bisporus H97]XP_007326325.1 uncharacterized protein AGABI1DRAFT_82136 [Agaricus bisporus var. burnettii JB137-S8]EKM82323.1 hypothetical protein AGABI1DRAFT_82136 [Agaricus bisporus var. burnettii JB137-S8]EKV49715.1 hypothetical protein AGABI2DRAFT_133629 [Agaricus bisporus var. bisporus H97]KAF7778431.1 hypothetical protein Agabi119p4_2776 [Agaricus bisporus var. burnettii]